MNRYVVVLYIYKLCCYSIVLHYISGESNPFLLPCYLLLLHREFEASVVILHHSTTIGCGYQPVIHCGVLRQAAEIVGIKGRETLKTSERATAKFRFQYFAEYLLPGSTFIFREGRAKGIGKVIQVFPLAAVAPT